MPSIKKQTGGSRSQTQTPATSNGSVLSRIAPLDDINVNRMKVSLFGTIGTGKTRLAGTFPKPMLIVGGEKGTDSIAGTKGVDFVQVFYGRMGDDFQELVEIAGSGKYATVVVDGLTKLRDIRVAEIMGLGSAPMQKGWGFAGRDEWTECANSLKHMLNPLLNLPNVMDLNVVFCSHESEINGEGKSQGVDLNSDSSIIKPCVSSMLGKSLAIWLNGDCNHVCQTFIRPGKELRTFPDPKRKGKTIQKEVSTGKPQWCIRTQPHDVYTIKFRVALGRPDPPEVIVDPSYEKMVKLIQG